MKNIKEGEEKWNPWKIEAIASWKSVNLLHGAMELASKGPISLSPKQKCGSWLPSYSPWCARVGILVFGSKLFELDPKKLIKYALLMLQVAKPRSCVGFGRSCVDPPCPLTAENFWLRDYTDPFWKNGHRDFVHRWIELKFGYVVLNPLIFNLTVQFCKILSEL